jgi:hypothetical protein
VLEGPLSSDRRAGFRQGGTLRHTANRIGRGEVRSPSSSPPHGVPGSSTTMSISRRETSPTLAATVRSMLNPIEPWRLTHRWSGNAPSRFHGKCFVLILYRDRAFGAFGNFRDFLESVSCKTSKTCQARGSNPCRGGTTQSPPRKAVPDTPFPLISAPASPRSPPR